MKSIALALVFAGAGFAGVITSGYLREGQMNANNFIFAASGYNDAGNYFELSLALPPRLFQLGPSVGSERCSPSAPSCTWDFGQSDTVMFDGALGASGYVVWEGIRHDLLPQNNGRYISIHFLVTGQPAESPTIPGQPGYYRWLFLGTAQISALLTIVDNNPASEQLTGLTLFTGSANQYPPGSEWDSLIEHTFVVPEPSSFALAAALLAVIAKSKGRWL